MRAKFASHSLVSLVMVAVLLVSTGCESHTPTFAPGEVPHLTNVSMVNSSTPAQLQSGLRAFYNDLARLQTGRLRQVSILQIGDSHTAADFFSGRLRDRLQQQFGNAGRGMLPPGVAFNGIDQRQIKVSQNKGWMVENSLKSPTLGPYGISGFVTRSMVSGAQMTLEANGPDNSFDWAAVEYYKHQGGGSFSVTVNGAKLGNVSTAGPNGQIGRFVIGNRGRLTSLTITARAEDIDIASLSTGRNDPGIVLSSHGVVGASADLFNHWSPSIVASDVATLHPSLVIIAYGTNEAFDSDFKPALYMQNFARVVASVRQYAPAASILIVGPPDASRGSSWEQPPALQNVRAIQQEVARSYGAAFWDWSGVMPDGMNAWVERGLARPDHVHFTRPGYEAAADQLYDWLMNGYAAMRAHAAQPAMRH